MQISPDATVVAPTPMGIRQGIAIAVMAGLLVAVPFIGNAATTGRDLTTLGLEELMNIEVTSVSKKVQRISDAAAAVFVITQEDIRRSGATSVPEALRMAPGVQVARIDSNKWAVSIRGFNGRFSNKLLVLMDGRSIFQPIFSGVFWEDQDTVLEDVERIEVIRGPGAALWGANAVNGVINIITKTADKTIGGLVSAGVGTEERGFATARYGAHLGQATDVRFYAKSFNRDGGVDASGTDANDSWRMTSGGFRLDSRTTERDTLSFQGAYFEGTLGETQNQYRLPTITAPSVLKTVNVENPTKGGNILSHWQRTVSATSDLSLQFSYDHFEPVVFGARGKLDTLDFDFQHRFSLGAVQDIVWGLGYRFSRDDVENSFVVTFTPPRRDDNLFSAFIHDQITLWPDRLALILGSRFEYSDYYGSQIQPNGRLLFTPSPKQTLWASVSRALRTPSRGDQDINYLATIVPPSAVNPLPTKVMIYGSRDLKSEELLAYELGYRAEPFSRLSTDIALFYNDYDNLRTTRMGVQSLDSPSAPTAVILPSLTVNDMHGHTYGTEFTLGYVPRPWWRIQASYSYLETKMDMDNGNTNLKAREDAEGNSPRHQLSFRSGFDVGKQVSLDLWLRAVDRLPQAYGGAISGYAAVDARLAWRPWKNLELSLVGQNLFQRYHQEFYPEVVDTLPTGVERSVYGKATWNF